MGWEAEAPNINTSPTETLIYSLIEKFARRVCLDTMAYKHTVFAGFFRELKW